LSIETRDMSSKGALSMPREKDGVAGVIRYKENNDFGQLTHLCFYFTAPHVRR
jgi:hypothetical protein